MNYKEFGKDIPKTIMLLHGGGLSWWNYREEANKLWQQALKKTEGDVPSLVICNPQNLYFVRDGLQIPDLGKVPIRAQGISIVENMNEWSWK